MSQMRPAILHLRDLGVGIVRMRPVVIRALPLALPIDARQIGTRGRSNARGLRERGQEFLIALAAIASHDAAQRRIRFQRRRVDAERLPLHQARRTQALAAPT
jgi:hypothetical protein